MKTKHMCAPLSFSWEWNVGNPWTFPQCQALLNCLALPSLPTARQATNLTLVSFISLPSFTVLVHLLWIPNQYII
jgi:hypothetical protein